MAKIQNAGVFPMTAPIAQFKGKTVNPASFGGKFKGNLTNVKGQVSGRRPRRVNPTKKFNPGVYNRAHKSVFGIK